MDRNSSQHSFEAGNDILEAPLPNDKLEPTIWYRLH